MKYTNNLDIPLPMQVWLLNDEYDYVNEPNYISATTLIRPLRQTILNKRIPWESRTKDLSELVASRLGNAIHDSVEKAWVTRGKELLIQLGMPEKQADKVIVNPSPKELTKDSIPIYMEKRTIREFMGYKIGGKFDLVMNGYLYDFKSTSTYTYTNGGNDEDYILQGSIYRWLNPEIITEDTLDIQFVFTDWQSSRARASNEYPQTRIVGKTYPLMSIEDTEKYIANRISEYNKYKDLPQDKLPQCSPEDLWQSETVYKYFSNPAKTDGRSTKNFTNKLEAHKFAVGKPGIVIEVPGEPKRCGYCDAYETCLQRIAMNV